MTSNGTVTPVPDGQATLSANHPYIQVIVGHGNHPDQALLEALVAAGKDIWVSWLDPIPPDAPGAPARPGTLIVHPSHQTYGHPTSARLIDVAYYSLPTNRRKRFRIADGTVLDLAVWRYGRSDKPCKTCKHTVCADCGTGAYWDLPQFIWPDPEIGLADPDNSTRLHPAEAMILAMSTRPVKVVYTDYALFSTGMAGAPNRRVTGRVRSVRSAKDGDRLIVKWNGKHGESVVYPNEVRLRRADDLT